MIGDHRKPLGFKLKERIQYPLLRSTRGLSNALPGRSVAHNFALLSVDFWLLWGIVACHFGLLGCPPAG